MIRMMWLCLMGGLLVSCIDEQVVSGETVLVSSQFALSTTDLSKSTRQGADVNEVMQDDGTFRGITDVYILPFEEPASVINTNSKPLMRHLELSSMHLPTLRPVTNEIPAVVTSNNAALYDEVAIPMHTRSVLFYGRAVDYSLPRLTQADLPYGVTLGSLSADEKADYLRHKNGVTSMPSTLGEGKVEEYNFRLQPIVSGEALTTKAQAIVSYLNTIVDAIPALSAPLVVDFLDNKAGSSAHLEPLLRTFYNLIKDDADYSGVCAAILAGFESGDINNGFISDYANYPRDFFLPDGAAAITYIEGHFQVNTGQTFGGMALAPPSIYAYPPALCYRVKSGVRTATESQISRYDLTSWEQVLGDGSVGYTDNRVRVGTASVAIKDPVQYAVARLDMQVKCEGSTLLASGGQTVTLNGSGFPITSILIDNQKVVDWQFEPVAPYDALTVYDNAIGAVYAPVGFYGATTHTLLMQTPRCERVNPSDETDYEHARHVTHIALELVNNTGVTFHGYNNQLILPDSHFYLVGALDPCEHAEFDKDDPDKSRVLTQDKTTSVSFTITTLENAYNVIPDLRAPSLEVSLRIDTDWQVGYHFTDTPIVLTPTP